MTRAEARTADNALRLPVRARARLALRLLESIEPSDGDPSEIDSLWAEEAERRASEVRRGRVRCVPSRRAISRLRAELGG